MQVRKVTIRNFRGIRFADWLLPEDRFVCLVGPGDSTKTTLLDAVGLVLSPRWNISFSDADFYNCQIGDPIFLQVVIGDLPAYLVRDETHGYDLSGLLPNGDLVHDPVDGAEACVVVQLKVTDTLEPEWTIVRPGAEDEGVPVSARARERFGLFRIDERSEAHLRWGRGSALTRLTAKGSGASAAVTEAHRAARSAVFEIEQTNALYAAATEVLRAAAEIGAAEFTWLRPGLDPTSSSTTHALLLHDDQIPLTGRGLGTRRLTSLAVQEKASTSGEIVLIDEVEHGLEPHRLHYLLRYLKRRTDSHTGQVIVTTHAPLVVETLQASDIAVVRCDEGQTTVQVVAGDLDEVQGTLRAGPSALLGRRVIVCEGKTEMGVVRRFLKHWDRQRTSAGKATHASLGVCQTDGHGSTDAPKRAKVLRQLGYPTLLVIDNDDRASDPGVDAAVAISAQVVRWQVGNALEDEIAAALSPAGLAALLALAADIKDGAAVRNAIGDRLEGQPTLSGLDPAAWTNGTRTLDDIRQAIGAAAKGRRTNDNKKDGAKAWFKLEETGELVGGLLIDHWDDVAGTPLDAGLRSLFLFAYGEDLG